ncbi:hypothetical protein ACFQVC_27110 [Streptomyces monticola]|uniref:Carboxypeptidase regulatory-like domain-containing protein n=1 Tax=Streptomyces monticola TaxID=2666263 RepID=A0ABW2JR56_9ACTN
MLRSLARGAGVTAAALALGSVFTASGAFAADYQGTPERLNAAAYYGSVDVLARQTHGLKAKLTKVDGSPVAGLPVTFTVAGEKTTLCEATTDTNGNAECQNSPLPLGIPTVKLVTAGYDATFDGNARYAPVSAHNSVGAL